MGLVFPVAPGSATIATDEVMPWSAGSAQHVAAGKLLDGREGGIMPMSVFKNGTIRTGDYFAGLFMILTPGQASYADKEVIGGTQQIGDGVPGGYWQLARIAVGLADLAGPTPAAIPMPAVGLALVPVTDGEPSPPLATDGGALVDAVPVTSVGASSVVPSSFIPPHPFLDWIRISGSSTDFLVASDGTSTISDVPVDLYGTLVADGAIAADLTPYSILVFGVMRYVGDEEPGVN